MRAKASITAPGKIEATISITATLEQWRTLREELKDTHLHGLGSQLVQAGLRLLRPGSR